MGIPSLAERRQAKHRRMLRDILRFIAPYVIIIGAILAYDLWRDRMHTPYCTARGLVYESRIDACIQSERPWETPR